MRQTVGIITFHWAPNYGAVLQCYALQCAIEQLGYDAEIIDYVPNNLKPSFLRCLYTKRVSSIRKNMDRLRRYQMLQTFCQTHYHLSQKLYPNYEVLCNDPPIYDITVSGSDQIWNPSFTMHGEGDVTLSYFLNFLPTKQRKVAYASSFGLPNIDADMRMCITPILKQYSTITVREKSGVGILKSMGIEAQYVLDPTLLMDRSFFDALCDGVQATSNDRQALCFFLNQPDAKCRDKLKSVLSQLNLPLMHTKKHPTIERWIRDISDAACVVTDSFHATVLAILYHKPFVAISTAKYDMSDRFYTLLDEIGLRARFVMEVTEVSLLSAMRSTIDWMAVEYRLSQLRTNSWQALKQMLEG